MVNKIFYSLIYLILICLIINLSRQILNTWRINQRLENKKEQVGSLGQRNSDLQKNLGRVQDTSFIEEIAREKLGMAKEGEKVILLPESIINEPVLASEDHLEEKPNWRKWWNLFFD